MSEEHSSARAAAIHSLVHQTRRPMSKQTPCLLDSYPYPPAAVYPHASGNAAVSSRPSARTKHRKTDASHGNFLAGGAITSITPPPSYFSVAPAGLSSWAPGLRPPVMPPHGTMPHTPAAWGGGVPPSPLRISLHGHVPPPALTPRPPRSTRLGSRLQALQHSDRKKCASQGHCQPDDQKDAPKSRM